MAGEDRLADAKRQHGRALDLQPRPDARRQLRRVDKDAERVFEEGVDLGKPGSNTTSPGEEVSRQQTTLGTCRQVFCPSLSSWGGLTYITTII